MASIKLKIEGIPGESTAKGYENWIDIESVNFDINREVSMAVGTSEGREGSLPQVSTIKISKMSDKSSIKLFEDSLNGSGKPAEVAFLTTGKSPSCYMSVKLTNSVVSNYNLSAHAESKPDESIEISFTAIEFAHTPHKDDVKAGNTMRVQFDLVKSVS